MLTAVFDDLRWAVRNLRRWRSVSGAVIAILALGVGANTALFTLLNAALLRPLPITAPHRLVPISLTNASASRSRRITFSPQGTARLARAVEWQEPPADWTRSEIR